MARKSSKQDTRTAREAPRSPKKPQGGSTSTSTHPMDLDRPRRPREPLVWLEGQQADGTWMPLYCSQDMATVRRWYLVILDRGDDHPANIKEGLHLYEDFRMRRETNGQA